MNAIIAMQKQKIVTVIGANYPSDLVPELLEKSFSAYSKRDFSKKFFQSSVHENTFATAGVLLTVLAIEAYRNRIFYLEKKEIQGVIYDLCKSFKSKNKVFPDKHFRRILDDIFVIRDVIAHNHIYEVEILNDDEWEMIGHNQRLLQGYGDNKRFSGLVNETTRKTKLLQLNVQPGKIGFEDLFTLLIIFELFVSISKKLYPNSYVPFMFNHQLGNIWHNNLLDYLFTFIPKIGNDKYTYFLGTLSKDLNSNYCDFVDRPFTLNTKKDTHFS